MLRRAHHFFSSTSLRQYATNSPRHLQLQAELSKTLEQYRNSSEQPTYLDELKHILVNYNEDGKKVVHPSKRNVELNRIGEKEEEHILKKELLMKRARNILAEIRSECTNTQAPLPTHLKLSK